jgi:proline iminopeptidase
MTAGACRRWPFFPALFAGAALLSSCVAAPVLRSGEVMVDGAHLHYRSQGNGPALVVVHGGPGLDHGYLVAGLEPLAATHRVVFYDQRGVGGSAGFSDEAINLAAYLRDLDALRHELGVDQLDLLAHSFGGIIALRYAIEHPTRVGSLILLNTVEPGQRYRTAQLQRQQALRTTEDSAAVAALVSSDAFAARDVATLERIYWHSFRPTFADRARASRLVMNLHPATAANGSRVAALLVGPLGAFDWWEELAAVRARTLLVHGVADAIPAEMVTELAARLPGAELLLVPDAGHFPHLEQPEAVFPAIRAFLRGTPARLPRPAS